MVHSGLIPVGCHRCRDVACGRLYGDGRALNLAPGIHHQHKLTDTRLSAGRRHAQRRTGLRVGLRHDGAGGILNLEHETVQRSGRRPLQVCAVRGEAGAVAGADELAGLRVPFAQARQVRAGFVQAEQPSWRVDQPKAAGRLVAWRTARRGQRRHRAQVKHTAKLVFCGEWLCEAQTEPQTRGCQRRQGSQPRPTECLTACYG